MTFNSGKRTWPTTGHPRRRARRQPTRKTGAALRQEVVELRKQRVSFSKIARALGISKSYAVKLSDAPEVPPQAGICDSTSLTVRQRRFAVALAEGETQRQAAIDAGVSPGGADSFAHRTLRDPRFQSAFHQLLDRAGLSEEAIARTHAENLRATKVACCATKDGKITDVLEVPDYAVRQRAVKDGYQLHGSFDRTCAENNNTGAVEVFIDPGMRAMIEHISGRPLPAKVWLPAPVQVTEQSEQLLNATATPAIPPMPADDDRLTADEAVSLAQARGEPQDVVCIFGSMRTYGLVIDGKTFKHFCQSGRAKPADSD